MESHRPLQRLSARQFGQGNGQQTQRRTNPHRQQQHDDNRYRNQSFRGSSFNPSYSRGRGFNRWRRVPESTNFNDNKSNERPLTMSDLPGFTWDPVRRRYFRVLPDHQAVLSSGQCSWESLRKQRQEEIRLRLMEGGMETDEQTTDKVEKRKNKTKSNVTGTLLNREKGGLSKDSVRRTVIEQCAKQVQPCATNIDKVLPDHPEDQLESCFFLENSADGRTIIGAWNLGRAWASNYWTRIMCLDVQSRDKKSGSGLGTKPTDNYIYACDPSVIDFCLAPVDSGVTCVLYVTVPSLPNVGSRVFLQPVPELSSEEDQDIVGSPIYNIHWTMNKGVSACAWNSNKMRVGLGMEEYGLIVDVVSETDFKLSSRHKNVLAQTFNKDGNLMFMGLRSSGIICCDLRLPSHHIVSSIPQLSTGSIHLLNDPNFMIAANFHGELKLWDVRNGKVLQEFDGYKNSHSKLPLVVDESENLLFAVGEDGITRGWSMRSGEKLCAIPSPYPLTHIKEVPRICYSNRWAGIEGNSALVLAVRDELHVHQMRL